VFLTKVFQKPLFAQCFHIHVRRKHNQVIWHCIWKGESVMSFEWRLHIHAGWELGQAVWNWIWKSERSMKTSAQRSHVDAARKVGQMIRYCLRKSERVMKTAKMCLV
jgi:hypothetical protein